MTEQAKSPVLEIENLTADYNGNRALTVNRLALHEQELMGVVGANGAGKSTLVGQSSTGRAARPASPAALCSTART